MQVVDAKEAGAAGVLGTIAQVSVRGAPVLCAGPHTPCSRV